jgi:uncharacterized membrane protein (DUF4010 family)
MQTCIPVCAQRFERVNTRQTYTGQAGYCHVTAMSDMADVAQMCQALADTTNGLSLSPEVLPAYAGATSVA